MKTRILTMCAVLSLMVTMVGVSAKAQDAVGATIPFAFSVGAKALPAGQYDVRQLSVCAMLVQNTASADSAMAVAMPTAAAKEPKAGQATLVFNRYGERYFLSEVWTEDLARRLPKSKLEREAARHAAETATNQHESEVIYLAARLN